MALDPGLSCLVQSQGSLAVTSNNPLPPATEQVLAGGQTFDANVTIPWNWPQVGGTKVRVGISGLVTVLVAPVTVRLRLGAGEAGYDSPSGTIVKSFTLAVGSHTVDELSDPVDMPAGIAYLQATAQSAGAATVYVSNLAICAVPQTPMQALLLATAKQINHGVTDPVSGLINGGAEVIAAQWVVDFDQFEATQIKYATAGRVDCSPGVTARLRVRVGGTFGGRVGGVFGASDGAVVLTYDVGPSGYGITRLLTGGAATVSKPSGIQLVKFTLQSVDGYPCSQQQCGLLLRAV